MKYIALLRGVNVDGNRRVEMKRLKDLFESFGYINVTTYINSGNVIFESETKQKMLQNEIPQKLKKEFGFEIQTLIKNDIEIKKFADAIPMDWKNDSEQRTDVAYLFSEIDSISILDELPLENEFIDVRYIEGAIYWNLDRKNLYKSHLGMLVSK